MPDDDMLDEAVRSTSPGWGFVAMQVTDAETQKRIIEEDPDSIDIKYVGPATRLVTRVRYVVCPAACVITGYASLYGMCEPVCCACLYSP